MGKTGMWSAMADDSGMARLGASMGVRVLGGVIIAGLAFAVLMLLTTKPAGASAISARGPAAGVSAVSGAVSPPGAPTVLGDPSRAAPPPHSGPPAATAPPAAPDESAVPSSGSPARLEAAQVPAVVPAVLPARPPQPLAPLPSLPSLRSLPSLPSLPSQSRRWLVTLPSLPSAGEERTPTRQSAAQSGRFARAAVPAGATRPGGALAAGWPTRWHQRPGTPIPVPRPPLTPESQPAVLDGTVGAGLHGGVSGALPPLAMLLALLVVAGAVTDRRRRMGSRGVLTFSPPG